MPILLTFRTGLVTILAAVAGKILSNIVAADESGDFCTGTVLISRINRMGTLSGNGVGIIDADFFADRKVSRQIYPLPVLLVSEVHFVAYTQLVPVGLHDDRVLSILWFGL